jgi:hypothetical protein
MHDHTSSGWRQGLLLALASGEAESGCCPVFFLEEQMQYMTCNKGANCMYLFEGIMNGVKQRRALAAQAGIMQCPAAPLVLSSQLLLPREGPRLHRQLLLSSLCFWHIGGHA